jgi:hypothetical protein
MGTNFYIRGHNHDTDPQWHIGKRSSAGPYCWDCRITLCKKGEQDIHMGCRKPGHIACDCGWHKECPKCGAKPVKEGLEAGSGGRELGFNKSRPKAKTGVQSCASFTWAMSPDTLSSYVSQGSAGQCPCCNRDYDDKEKIIQDEYGDLFTWHEFLMILEECPVQYNDSIGQEFS